MSGLVRVVRTVRSGLGDCAQYVERYREAYREVTGVELFPGTLNVELESEWSSPADALVLDLRERGGTVVVLVTPCAIEGEPAFVLRTGANEAGNGDHPRTIVEVASRWHLRERHGLEDGDRVELDLP